MKYKILVIDDEHLIRLSLREGLTDLGYEIETASGIAQGLELAERFAPHFVLLDNRLGVDRGIDSIAAIKKIDDDIQLVMMTAYGSVSQAVDAVKRGAYDYILKPFDLDALDLLIRRCLEQLAARRSLRLAGPPRHELIGESPAIARIRGLVEVIAKNDHVDLLIRGETGTGKEVVANLVHRQSARSNLPMVKINCGAIPENLLESELFGHERGAFTGAIKTKKGLLELANGSTVFLDEIGEMPLSMQAKLLTFLEDRRFKRVGGLLDIEVNVRVIAATNRDLKAAIARKEFREDLFYRLNVMQIEIPPLRERPEDVLPLAKHFLERCNRKFGKNIRALSPAFERDLILYSWKGNVREMRNIIERSALFCEGELLERGALLEERPAAEALVVLPGWEEGKIDLPGEISRLERGYVEEALRRSENNLSKAAELLGLTRFSLRRKLDSWGKMMD